MKTNEIEDLGTVYPSPNQSSPNSRPGKSQQEQSDDDDDESIYDDEEQLDDFEEDDDMEEFDIAGSYSGNMKDVYDYMNSSL